MNLQDDLDKLPEPPKLEKGRYRHYKGNEYDVVGVAFHTETLEPLVVYRAVEHKKGAEFWVRPYDMFFEEILVGGERVPRFTKISE
jgi:hypothetical protein